MSKKNIITDFGSLKGKVTFSEQKPVVEKQTEKVAATEKEKEDKVLKVGQKVVLMDSDLRGTIISLGKSKNMS